MGSRKLLEDIGSVKKLADCLEKCPQVQSFDKGDEKEAWTLAHSFRDIEESFLIFREAQLPRLLEDNLEPSEVYDLLLDIGEELRHILYHIKDPRFYRYLQQESDRKNE